MDWIYRIALFVLIVGIGSAAEGWIIHRVYKIGRADGWDAARSAYIAWKENVQRAAVNQEADAA